MTRAAGRKTEHLNLKQKFRKIFHSYFHWAHLDLSSLSDGHQPLVQVELSALRHVCHVTCEGRVTQAVTWPGADTETHPHHLTRRRVTSDNGDNNNNNTHLAEGHILTAVDDVSPLQVLVPRSPGSDVGLKHLTGWLRNSLKYIKSDLKHQNIIHIHCSPRIDNSLFCLLVWCLVFLLWSWLLSSSSGHKGWLEFITCSIIWPG